MDYVVLSPRSVFNTVKFFIVQFLLLDQRISFIGRRKLTAGVTKVHVQDKILLVKIVFKFNSEIESTFKRF